MIIVGSKGERIIAEYLISNNIPFEREVMLGDTRRYDFYLPNDNLIVEVHGSQHYREVRRFKDSSLKEIQEIDRLKEAKAKKQGYNYMVVDYKEGKPDLALERFKKQYAKREQNG